MPLRDQFWKPWEAGVVWDSLCFVGVTNTVKALNRDVLPGGYYALAQVLRGTFGVDSPDIIGSIPDETVPSKLPAQLLRFDFDQPDQFAAMIHEEGRPLSLRVVIEFVTRGMKESEEVRARVVQRCAGYLALGIGVVLVDFITDRNANLHNELLAKIAPPRLRRVMESSTYVAAYRPHGYGHVETIDVWSQVATIGQPIPAVPMPLMNGPELVLDLESVCVQCLHDHNFE
jgi:hypothetical protein